MTSAVLGWLYAIGTAFSLILFTISCLTVAGNLTGWRGEKGSRK